MTIDSMSLGIYSDLHKDVYGFRPRGVTFNTRDEYEAEMDYLSKVLDEQMDADRKAMDKADADFAAFVSDLMETHGIAHKDAVRWALQAEGCDFSHTQAVEHTFWELGMSFTKIDEYTKIVREFVTWEY